MSIKSSTTSVIRKGTELLNHLGEIVEIGGKLTIKTDLAETISQIVNALENLIKNSNNAQAGSILRDIKEKLFNINCLVVLPPQNLTILNRFSVDIYQSLHEFYLTQCPPSTIQNFSSLQTSLIKLTIVNSGITDLGEIFIPSAAEPMRKKLPPYIKPSHSASISSKYCWNRLIYLSLANCGLISMDESFHFFPSLIELDISHNDIQTITHLQDCIALESINASHNRIVSLFHLERTIGHVKRMNLSHNDILSLEGLDKVYSLEDINIAHNKVEDFQQIQYLSRLPNLESILLINNPIAERRHYRLKVYREFVRVGAMMTGNRDFPELDKAPIARSELHKLRKFMFRAPTDAMVESSLGYHPIQLEHHGEEDDFDDEGTFDQEHDTDTDVEVYTNSAQNAKVSQQTIALKKQQQVQQQLTPSSPQSMAHQQSAAAASKRRSFGNKRNSTGGGAGGGGQYGSMSSPMSPNGHAGGGGGGYNPWRNKSTNAPQPPPTYASRYSGCRKSVNGIVTTNGPGTFSLKRSKRSKHTATVYEGLKPQGKLFTIDEIKQAIEEDRDEWLAPFLPPPPVINAIVEEPIVVVDQAAITPPSLLLLDEGMMMMERKVSMEFGSPGADRISRRMSSANIPSAAAAGLVGATSGIAIITDNNDWGEKGGQSLFDGQQMSQSPPKLPPSFASSTYSNHLLDDNHNNSGSPVSSFPRRGSDAVAVDLLVHALAPQHNNAPNLTNPNPAIQRQPSLDSNSMSGRLNLIDCYAGDRQYRNLLILDNLELYFREQVFSPNRPTFPDLYLQHPKHSSATNNSNNTNSGMNSPTRQTRSATSTSTNSSSSTTNTNTTAPNNNSNASTNTSASISDANTNNPTNTIPSNTANNARHNSTTSNKIMDDYSLHFVTPFLPEEKVVAIYIEKVIVLKSSTSAMTLQAIQATNQANAVNSTAATVPSNAATAATNPATITNTTATATANNTTTTNSLPPVVISTVGGDGDEVEDHTEDVIEFQAIIILTDVGFYMMNMQEINAKHVFGDTPLYTIVACFPLLKLTICTIYFSFQRCALQFLDPPELSSTGTGTGTTTSSHYHTILGAYMFMTRDKARTYPMITKIPQLANQSRHLYGYHNVKIENKDEQLLSQLSNYYTSIPPLITAHDITYYQLIYQVWRKKPGYKRSRSLIITPKVILLCNESWNMISVSLQVYEWYLIKDISKLLMEENQCYVTLIFKRYNMLSGKKKWRLYNESMIQSIKCYDACKAACVDNGNPDV